MQTIFAVRMKLCKRIVNIFGIIEILQSLLVKIQSLNHFQLKQVEIFSLSLVGYKEKSSSNLRQYSEWYDRHASINLHPYRETRVQEIISIYREEGQHIHSLREVYITRCKQKLLWQKICTLQYIQIYTRKSYQTTRSKLSQS